jgi:hypothetical protein
VTSFIEMPQIGFNGQELPSLYVNVADIIAFKATYDGATEFELRDLGTEGMSVTRRSYLPIGLFLNLLGMLAENPGVKSWTDETKAAHLEPAQERSRAAAARERGEHVLVDKSID